MPDNIDLGTVLYYMRQALSIPGLEDYHHLMARTLRLMAEAHLIEVRDTNYDDEYVRLPTSIKSLFVEAYQYLLNQLIIIPKPDTVGYPTSLPYVITERGREWIETDEILPEDSARFMRTLKDLVPRLDPVIEQYIDEALITYQRQAYFAAAVMVGAAAEKAIYLLIEAIKDAVQDAAKKQDISKEIEQRGLPTLFRRISDTLEPLKQSRNLPYSVHEGSDRHLLSFQESIRVQRNDAVHPATRQVNPRMVWLSLAAFPQAIRKIYDLIEWLNSNQI